MVRVCGSECYRRAEYPPSELAEFQFIRRGVAADAVFHSTFDDAYIGDVRP